MKKITIWLTTIIIILSMIAVFSIPGCAQAGEPTEEATEETAEPTEEVVEEADEVEEETAEVEKGATLSMLTPYVANEGLFDDLCRKYVGDFEEKYGVTVELSGSPWEGFYDKVETMFAGGNAPDVIVPVLPTYFVRFAEEGVLLPLDDYIDIKEVTNGFNQMQTEVIPSLTDDGKTYGIIHYANYNLWWYNTNILEDAGYSWPTSIEEFKTMVADMTTDEVKGLGFTWRPGDWVDSHYSLIIYTYGMGGDYFKDGKPNFDSEEVIAAVELIKEMYDAGYVTKDTGWNDLRKMAATGKVGTYPANPNEFTILQGINPDLATDDFQSAEWFTDNPSYNAIVQTMIANKDTKYPKAAAKLIEVFTNFENQEDWFIQTGVTVARTDVFNNEEARNKVLDLRPNSEAVFEIADSTKYMVPPEMLKMENNQRVLEAWFNWTERVLYEDLDAREAMESLQAEAMGLMGL